MSVVLQTPYSVVGIKITNYQDWRWKFLYQLAEFCPRKSLSWWQVKRANSDFPVSYVYSGRHSL